MNDSIKRIKILGRAQAVVLRAHVRRTMQRLVVMVFGCIFALFALGVLNHAAYSAIESRLGPVEAGIIVGAVDLLLSALFFLKALSDQQPSEEERMAQEITELASDGLSADFEQAREEAREFMESTKRLGDVARGISSILGGPLAQLVQFLTQAAPIPMDKSKH